MRISKRLLQTLCVSALLLPTLGSAQTTEEFRRRYGPPDDIGRFIVRPNITAEVKYLNDGRISKVVIEPQGLEPREESFVRYIPVQLATEIIDEISPLNRRGALVFSITFSAGCTSIAVDLYESVRIRRTMLCTSEGTIKSAEIVFKVVRGLPL